MYVVYHPGHQDGIFIYLFIYLFTYSLIACDLDIQIVAMYTPPIPSHNERRSPNASPRTACYAEQSTPPWGTSECCRVSLS